jgi:hypothetical protein
VEALTVQRGTEGRSSEALRAAEVRATRSTGRWKRGVHRRLVNTGLPKVCAAGSNRQHPLRLSRGMPFPVQDSLAQAAQKLTGQKRRLQSVDFLQSFLGERDETGQLLL